MGGELFFAQLHVGAARRREVSNSHGVQLSEREPAVPLDILRTGDTPLKQMIAHGFPRAEQTVLDGAERETCDFGNFVVA